MPAVGHPRIAERADEHRVELVPQHRVPVRGHRDAGREIVVGPPRELLDLERAPEHVADTPDRADGFGYDLFADAVAGDYCEAHGDIIVMHNAQCTMHNADGRAR